MSEGARQCDCIGQLDSRTNCYSLYDSLTVGQGAFRTGHHNCETMGKENIM